MVIMLASLPPSGNDTTPITLLSLADTAALALATHYLLRLLGVTDADRAAALIFALPVIALSAGLMGRYDTLWATPVVMAIAAAIQRRPITMLAWCGLALGLTIQALLIAPFFLALLINRRVPIRLWPIAPLTTAATMMAAWCIGRPVFDFASASERQIDAYVALSFDAPNIWAIAQTLPLGGTPLLGLALAAAIGTTIAYVAHFSAQPLTDKSTTSVALLGILLMAGLLPGMHERDFFLANILALVMALALRDLGSIRIAALVQAGSILGLLGHASGIDALPILGAVAMIAATFQLARPLLKPAANDNPLIARTV
ncbi:hypothetical protein [Sphingomonas alpina]|uniref:Uncharacterized protein n=1 Tax=Sphingomonas alpina TaxID=653931 RepID=A0A7H0LPQ4_9SPHN|nr:hypothetical protein [Sphingomonas alpina]QNQ11657.1 hypothetical protein H3Z74_11285 [Sphingomonas alpina]